MIGYIFPTRTNLNPARPETAEFYAADLVAYLLTVPGEPSRSKVVTSAGDLGAEWAVGTWHELASDQTRRKLGIYQIHGVKHFDSGEFTGEVLDRWMPHWVFK